jgi:hypothetical protein
MFEEYGCGVNARSSTLTVQGLVSGSSTMTWVNNRFTPTGAWFVGPLTYTPAYHSVPSPEFGTGSEIMNQEMGLSGFHPLTESAMWFDGDGTASVTSERVVEGC